ncbi:MAG: pyrroloquinoline quinone biosynthesis protein PqqB [Flavobacteriales bacterium]|jgi:pyrroloquinoline quinone biosynthesis protein B|nr:MAG: pyrroloquinoline quinone biosynthesis protein PqqB [Flavobacteriales bacterium]
MVFYRNLKGLFFILIIFLSACQKTNTIKRNKPNDVILKVLGTIQDGGIPHMGCNKVCCLKYFKNNTFRVGVSSLGISNLKNETNYLIDATPNINHQLKALIGTSNPSEKLNGIFLTHAHMGHYSGLLNFGREAMNSKNIPLYLMPRFYNFIQDNGPWNQLVKLENVMLKRIYDREKITLESNLSITPIQVPHRDEYSETVGFLIEGNTKSALYIPDIDKWEKWNNSIVELIKNVDYAFLDGTFYDEKEVNNRDISEIPHPFIIESLKLFNPLDKSEKNKIYFIHLNHTNPLLNSDSSEYNRVIREGFNVADPNMEFFL